MYFPAKPGPGFSVAKRRFVSVRPMPDLRMLKKFCIEEVISSAGGSGKAGRLLEVFPPEIEFDLCRHSKKRGHRAIRFHSNCHFWSFGAEKLSSAAFRA